MAGTPEAFIVALNGFAGLLAVAFALIAALRVKQLKDRPRIKPSNDLACAIKLILSLVILVTSSLIASGQIVANAPDGLRAHMNTAAAAVAALVLVGLTCLEHSRSQRPSDLIQVFLLGSMIRDGITIGFRSQQVKKELQTFVVAFQLFIEALLFIIESLGSRKNVTTTTAVSPEEEASILGRILFSWVNEILLEGYSKILAVADLPPLGRDLRAGESRSDILKAWDQQGADESWQALPTVLLRCLLLPFLGAIPLRLFLILFKYLQPVLIKKAIEFVTASGFQTTSWDGRMLVAGAVTVYVGLAITTASYQQCLNRLRVKTRNALILLIEDKTMRSWADASLEGRVLTLISVDVDALETIPEMVHEIWGQALEVMVGFFLLSREVGWLWPVPLAMILVCSKSSQYVARNLRSKQDAWNCATQDRISFTSFMISNIKTIKMIGLQSNIARYLETLRTVELKMAGKVRWIMIAYNASANALGIFAPVVTIVLFAVLARMDYRQLDTKTAFTAIAILTMVTHPANMVMTHVPRLFASSASFERIQKFLMEMSREDRRAATVESVRAVSIRNLTIGHTEPVLKNLTLDVEAGSIVAIMGSTGCGKSLIAKAIVGEIYTQAGTEIIMTSHLVAYCSQQPWLPSGSIKDVITQYGSDEPNNEDWYQEVLDACCLTEDLLMLPGGDSAEVGPRGMNLSGGQRQRVALARAAYSRYPIVVLDDTFSALDWRTENRVVSSLIGPQGIFRSPRRTVILIGNSTQHFHFVDQVFVLGSGKITEQGKWEDIKVKGKSIAKMTIDHGDSAQEQRRVAETLKIPIRPKQPHMEATGNLNRQTGDASLYAFYMQSAGCKNFIFMASCTVVYSFFITVPQYWLKIWTDADTSQTGDLPFMIGYGLLAFMAWATTSVMMWSTLMRVAPCSGQVLHSRLLFTIIGAPLSYFSTTNSGSILNRFSQDMQLVDKQLPPAMSTLGVQIFKLTMQVALLFITHRVLLLTLPVCLIVVYFVQKLYLRTSRQLRFLELESRSGVMAAFLETFSGLSTIRSLDGSGRVTINHIKQVDESHKPLYLLLCLQRWLNLVLDLLVAAISVGVISLAVILKDSTTGSEIGMALNVLLVVNTTLLRLVESWANIEISLGAIARLKSLEYEIPNDGKPGEDVVPPETWPHEGALKVDCITASYNTNSDVLEGVSLYVPPGVKVVVCGRTGSGKSSFLLALLRLIHVKHGSVIVDGINTARIPRHVLRERCFVTVPQDAMLAGDATLRFNLDPSESLSDDTLLGVLAKVRMRPHFTPQASMHGALSPNQARDVLNRPLSVLPALSVGQGQLIALARALLQVHTVNTSGAKPIVLLDEATSSLDASTQELILDIVHEELTRKGFTVIIVAHRLSAVATHMDEDDIVVWMRDGQIQSVGGRDDLIK
ncbi:unnamed protein product [Clonostachys rhizophaga]|uniref:Uncharacterized protein n=1 Tax=Clonostachys rhizophaga TaxID=160324 RepID=A0A9N9VGC2_9HYPO|nr:unnamed protein product [Clonostachys rhizophaga]